MQKKEICDCRISEGLVQAQENTVATKRDKMALPISSDNSNLQESFNERLRKLI